MNFEMIKLNETQQKEIAELSKQLESIEKTWNTNPDFSVIASTDTIDRHGEVIDPKGWELAKYKTNPVILACHNSRTLNNLIWKATKVEIKNNQLLIEWIFSKTNILAQTAKKLYDEWILKTVSVWFITKERVWNIITKAELLEVSFVPVPANPDALSQEQKNYLNWFKQMIWFKEEVKTNEESEIKQILIEIKEIKEILADDKAETKDFETKELLQSINRATAEALREFKKK